MTKIRVLIVDDEVIQRNLIREVIESSGEPYQLLEASNGIEAIEVLQQNTVDAVLIDKCMPSMDGDQVCRYIRHELNLPLLPLIIVTATNSSEELRRSFAAGANDFVCKPFHPIELMSRLRNAIKNKRLTDQLDNAGTLLFALARMVEAKDVTTGDHCSRLSHMSVAFGKKLKLSSDELENLSRGGVLHDIGKLGIPDSILMKEGPLDEDEWKIMQSHTVIGGHLCEGLSSIREVIPIILHHHEKWDGSGYPYGLAGEQIPLLARVFQLIDIYDALASERPYKKKLSLDKIISIFEEERDRGWRDPELTSTFIELLRNSPEELNVPQDRKKSRDEQIFQHIARTGAIDWDKNKNKVEK